MKINSVQYDISQSVAIWILETITRSADIFCTHHAHFDNLYFWISKQLNSQLHIIAFFSFSAFCVRQLLSNPPAKQQFFLPSPGDCQLSDWLDLGPCRNDCGATGHYGYCRMHTRHLISVG